VCSSFLKSGETSRPCSRRSQGSQSHAFHFEGAHHHRHTQTYRTATTAYYRLGVFGRTSRARTRRYLGGHTRHGG
jgi:hypothetical protein